MTNPDHLAAFFEELTHISPAFADARGEIANILTGVAVNHIAIITSAAGSFRGNHWHPPGTGDQYMYIIAGALVAYAKDLSDQRNPITAQRVESRTLMRCPPGIAHAYGYLEPTVFLNIGTDGRETARLEEHTLPYALVGEDGKPLEKDVPFMIHRASPEALSGIVLPFEGRR